MSDAADIDYFALGLEDFDESARLLEDDFFPREPLSIGTHLVTSASTGKIGRKLRECLASGVSFGARDVKTRSLVAVRLSYTATKEHSADEDPVDEEKSEYEIKVSGLIEEVASKVDVFQDHDVNKVLYMYMLCVRRNYGGRGIGKKLVRMTMERGKDLGCQLAFTTITNVLSGRIFAGLGYETRYTLDMSTPEGDRGMDLAAMDGNRTVRIMTIRL
ncbi:uncharacterized protein LOC125036661 [Penaeus chinensis]|uniref:uncharacterized protein LOC125036661 n=1 Tax=Penaeus chinensis TaxID=139456 RepID=UPI001FB736FA|nr:uncharacterized protein LOC125036661 [Penaeus chinensis]